MQPDCVFCKIVLEEIPAEVVWAGSQYIAVRDRNPQAPVHLVVISNYHATRQEGFAEDSHTVQAFLPAVRRAAAKAGLADYRLIMNCGPGAGQTVLHMHAHILGGWETAPEIVGPR